MRVTPDVSTARWRKSSYSGNQQGDACVEVCDDFADAVPVRDSKNLTGPVMMLDGEAWRSFVGSVKDGSL
ncbi:DUF397 domain-containing protein [Streptomyces sp. NPDC085927]|uniref:DUF397 domain-containing protein n=1 Tax=Streptomyces sp. NPDC085927 TaxID=3365738 RepID=UPI0037D84083